MFRLPWIFQTCLLATLTLSASAARAQFTVPDDYPTIAAAIAAGAEEIWVRGGIYDERPVIDRPLALRGLLPPGATQLPEIAGLVLDDEHQLSSHSARVTISDLRITGQVRATIHAGQNSGPLTMRFERCVLDSGLTDDESTVGSQHGWSFTETRVHGPLRLRWPDGVGISNCTFTGPVSLSPDESAHVAGSRFEGPGEVGLSVGGNLDYARIEFNTVIGRDVGISTLDVNTLVVAGNVVEGSAVVGLRVHDAEGATIAANRVRGSGSAISVVQAEVLTLDGNQAEDCAGGIGVAASQWADVRNQRIVNCGSGLYVDGEEVRSRDNYVKSCGSGIRLVIESGNGSATRDTILDCGVGLTLEGRSGSDGTVTACRVIGVGGPGIHLSGRIVAAAENVVGRAMGPGIVVASEDQATLRRNTSYHNGGSGLALLAAPSGASVSRNIGLGNARYGLEAPADLVVTPDANDWFANGLGAVDGVALGITDTELDPLFCNLAGDDASLGSDSPFAGALPEVQVGALGVGCEVGLTPTQVSLFAAERLGGTVVVRWIARASAGATLVVERADDFEGPWNGVAGMSSREGDIFTVSDAAAGETVVWYRLIERTGASSVVLAGPIRVDAPAHAFALIGISPNPGAGPQRIEFSLARAAAISIDVFDLQGRLLATPARGSWEAGRHVVEWRASESLTPGLYVVRFAYPGGSESRKWMRAR